MAVTTTSFTPTPIIFPFKGLTEVVREQTGIARSAVLFSNIGGSVTAGGAGNEQRISIVCTLPTNFTYVISDLSFQVVGAAAGTLNWENIANFGITDSITGSTNQTYSHISELFSDGEHDLVGVKAKIYRPMNLPNITISSAPGESCGCSINLMNMTQNGIACTINLYIRFWMYDVSQALHYAVNSPDLVRG